ncbi:MAG: glycosyltransferase family 1 protein [Rhodococcus sp. (in: high G+C Gram-positive bacteria)]
MKILYPSRIVSRNVGGNTTYGRALVDGLASTGVEVEEIKSGRHPATTLLHENIARYTSKSPGTMIHYLADTGSLLGGGAPSVVTVHGIASRWIDGVRSRTQELVWRSRVARAIATSEAVITPSDSSAADIAEIFDVSADVIRVVPHGIEHATNFDLDPEISLSESIRHRVPSNYLLYVGNIEPRKNIPALVRAMNAPSVRALGLKLVIAGKPAWNFEDSMEAISASIDVVYLGFVSDSDRNILMKRCAAFIFPSRYEGFGFPVLEALSLGCLVITSDRGSLAEVAGPSWRIEELDSGGIAAAIVQAMQDTNWSRRCVAEAPSWVSKFSWRRSVASHHDIYCEVLNS